MKSLLVILIGITLSFSAMAQDAKSLDEKNFHDFEVKNIDGENFDLGKLEGKKVLVVNTASECGYTPQYEGLQKLYEKFESKDFTVIGFPANNFANQEPGSDEDIKEFCTSEFGVTFPMMSKISVKEGDDQHPLYQWLTSKEYNDTKDSKVKWNFQKYLINEDGELAEVIYSDTKPMDKEIVSWIKNSSSGSKDKCE